MKYRKLDEDEPWEKGDILHYIDHPDIIVTGLLIGKTLQEWRLPGIYDSVTRPIESKKLKLSELVKKLYPDGYIILDSDGAIYIRYHSNCRQLTFDTVESLKRYLTIPLGVDTA